jgi:hypothetical protein
MESASLLLGPKFPESTFLVTRSSPSLVRFSRARVRASLGEGEGQGEGKEC